MDHITFGRRGFLGGTALAAVGAVAGRPAHAAGGGDETFQYEVQRSEDEWRAQLSETEYNIMREGGTEAAHSSPLADETRTGIFCCKGCDLTLYESEWKVPLGLGWVFFSHAQPDAVLLGIDTGSPYGGMPNAEDGALIEVHCRRCGSHLGHLVGPGGEIVHCINGAAMTFQEAAA